MAHDTTGLNVAILLFPDVEELDFVGPYEVFAVASRVEISGMRTSHRIQLFTVAERAGPLRGRGGLTVIPDHDLDSCPRIDLLVVPGGLGTRREVDNPRLVGWIREIGRTATIASVCTGSFLLGKAGLLGGLPATTHWASIARMREAFPEVQVRDELRIVDAGSVVTSAGISAGIDMALHLVARLEGEQIARGVARQMEYPWRVSPS